MICAFVFSLNSDCDLSEIIIGRSGSNSWVWKDGSPSARKSWWQIIPEAFLSDFDFEAIFIVGAFDGVIGMGTSTAKSESSLLGEAGTYTYETVFDFASEEVFVVVGPTGFDFFTSINVWIRFPAGDFNILFYLFISDFGVCSIFIIFKFFS